MKLSMAVPALAAAGLLGCSPGGLSLTGTPCSGDLGSFVAQCITNRGGRPVSTNLPAIPVQWTYQFRPVEDIVLVAGDHFSEVRSFLKNAYGEPDSSAASSPFHPMGLGQSGWYGPKQIGVTLNLTGDARQTVICILGQYGSPASPPNPQGGANGWQPLNSGTNQTSAAAGH
jgi:hypothetical protein